MVGQLFASPSTLLQIICLWTLANTIGAFFQLFLLVIRGYSKERSSVIAFVSKVKNMHENTSPAQLGIDRNKTRGKCLMEILVSNDTLQDFGLPFTSMMKDFTEVRIRRVFFWFIIALK